MNLELLESFGQNFPEDFDGILDCMSIAVTCSFNRRGTLLGVGCNDGRIVIWDFLTRGIAKIISAHVHPICSLSWERTGHRILSAGTDGMVSIWDVLKGECISSFKFPTPVLRVQYHPRDSSQFLVTPMKHASVLMTTDGAQRIIPVDEEGDLNICSSFDRQGTHIYTGNARGRVLVFNSTTLDLDASFKVSTSPTAIKSVEFSRRGDCFLINSSDRMIRVYDSAEVLVCGKDGPVEPIQKLQDLVNKSLWKKCHFSGDGEYIVAGSARQHSLYIWEKVSGNLVKFLLGTKGEILLDVVWHPVRPIIASISNGVVSIWSQTQVENWSAFAPDFKELDENLEYDEKESEFDVSDEDKEAADVKASGPDDEDVEVNVTDIEKIAAFVSSDEDDNESDVLLYLPIAPEVEENEDAWNEPHHTASPEKRRSLSRDSPSKRSKVSVIDVDLPDASIDEVHPLLASKKSQPEKHNGGGGGGGQKRSGGKWAKNSKSHVSKSESKLKNNHGKEAGDYYKENYS